ncbi:MAG: hypothetical protein AB1716_13680 [Planctomycetota bacterium]
MTAAPPSVLIPPTPETDPVENLQPPVEPAVSEPVAAALVRTRGAGLRALPVLALRALTAPARMSRADQLVLGLIVVLTVVLTPVVVNAPNIVGSYLDDGIYLVTGKSLADGRGYRHLELPGEPLQTKYPPMYPALLAAVWAVFPDFPQNVPVFQVLNCLLWGLGSWLVYRLMRRAWRLPWWLAFSGAALGFINPVTMTVLMAPMSEPLFLVLSAGALLLATPQADDTAKTTGAARRALALAALAGALAAAAYLTRSLGLAALVAIPAGYLLRRHFAAGAAATLAGGVGAAGWHIWRAGAMAENAANPMIRAFRYDTDYSAWLPASAGSLAWVVYQNISALAVSFFAVSVATPGRWIESRLAAGPAAALPIYIAMTAMVVLVLIGAVGAWGRRRAELHIYLLIYVGLLLAWPYSAPRLLLPILPLLTTLLLCGIYVCVLAAGRLLKGARRPAVLANLDYAARWAKGRPGSEVAIHLAGPVAVVLGALHALQIFMPGDAYIKDIETNCRIREGLVQFIQKEVPAGAVVAANQGGYMHLRTGRKFVPHLPYDDVVSVQYPADRTFAGCGLVVTPGMRAADLAYAEEWLTEQLRLTGATYVVPLDPGTTYGKAFADTRREFPGYFDVVGKPGPLTAYRVRLPATRSLAAAGR